MTKTQIRFTLGLAVALAAVSIAMPNAADAFFHRPYNNAPEVDPSTLSSAIALAMGGLAVLGDKLRRR
jgi:hypothetical protein